VTARGSGTRSAPPGQTKVPLSASTPALANPAGVRAELYEKPAITAAAEHARGTLELAQDDPAEAARRLQSAPQLWQGVGAPYDDALARTLLAQALLAQDERQDCNRELQAAGAAFERLGARTDLEQVREQIAAVPSP